MVNFFMNPFTLLGPQSRYLEPHVNRIPVYRDGRQIADTAFDMYGNFHFPLSDELYQLWNNNELRPEFLVKSWTDDPTEDRFTITRVDLIDGYRN